uniref:Uncharacterized protein n=1 Tax=Rhizophora mucronata TaxID=61149 RepID=A0A2P2MQP4_RHIMU
MDVWFLPIWQHFSFFKIKNCMTPAASSSQCYPIVLLHVDPIKTPNYTSG